MAGGATCTPTSVPSEPAQLPKQALENYHAAYEKLLAVYLVQHCSLFCAPSDTV